MSTGLCAAVLSTLLGCGGESKPAANRSSSTSSSKSVVRPEVRRAISVETASGGKVFIHRDSQTAFQLPDGWAAEKPTKQFDVTVLRLRHASSAAFADLTWVPLDKSLKKAVEIAHLGLCRRYGRENVTGIRTVTVGRKSGYQFDLKVGPKKDASKHGTAYYFEAAPEPKSRWRLQLRVTFAAAEKTDFGKLLVNHIHWTLKPLGPASR